MAEISAIFHQNIYVGGIFRHIGTRSDSEPLSVVEEGRRASGQFSGLRSSGIIFRHTKKKGIRGGLHTFRYEVGL